MYRQTRLEYIVKADDAQGALDSAGGYDVDSINPCYGDGMEGCFRVCVDLEASDLEELLGKPGKGVSFKEAQKRAEMVQKANEARYGKMDTAIGGY